MADADIKDCVVLGIVGLLAIGGAAAYSGFIPGSNAAVPNVENFASSLLKKVFDPVTCGSLVELSNDC
jgi:hypothetical protein